MIILYVQIKMCLYVYVCLHAYMVLRHYCRIVYFMTDDGFQDSSSRSQRNVWAQSKVTASSDDGSLGSLGLQCAKSQSLKSQTV